jgi:uncharacterized membrane protein
MNLFADYEGLGVIFSELFWFAATIPALICALAGTIAGALRVPRPRLAFWLGIVACGIEMLAAAFVQFSFFDAQPRLGAHAEQFRPGWFFWSGSLGTTALALLAIGLGLSRRSTALESVSHEDG